MPNDIVTISVQSGYGIGTEFGGWEALSITRTLDSCADAFSMAAPFNPQNEQVANAFRPFAYKRAVIKVDDEKILTGMIEATESSVSAGDRAMTIQGRSLTGPLIDCAVDIGRYEFKGLTLAALAREVTQPHGIEVDARADSPAIEVAQLQPGQTGFEFLNAYAKARGILLTCDERGRLVLDLVPVSRGFMGSLKEGERPLLSASGSFNGSARFSKYKALLQSEGQADFVEVAEDSGVPIYRPRIITDSQCEPSGLPAAAKWARALALAESVGVSVSVSGWRGQSGALWAPGASVSLEAPGAYILRATRFVIAEVTLKLDTGGRTADMRLVLDATYTGEMPGAYPWE